MAYVYGDNTVFESIKTCLKTIMDNLKAAMDAAETDPRPGGIYEGHEQHNMTLPAVTVGIDEAEIIANEAGIGQSGAISLPMNIVAEIRVHTDYAGGYLDKVKCWRLLNSISNYVKTNGRDYLRTNLTGFLAIEFAPGEFGLEESSFDDTLTIGGYYKFVIQVVFTHAQA